MKSNPRHSTFREFIFPHIVFSQSFLKIVRTTSISFLEFFAPKHIHVGHCFIQETILRRRRPALRDAPRCLAHPPLAETTLAPFRG
jgi:hypothetical protein